MWRAVVDKEGKKVDNPSIFFYILRGEHQVSTMVEMLDTDFSTIDGGLLFSADQKNELTNFITDGNIDVDTTRPIRRTAEITLLNPTGDFSPNTEEYKSDGDWVGKIYLNRMVRIWRGVYYENQPIYVPCGTFFIDVIDVQVEQNMSQVVLTMSDRWKMLNKSIFSSDRTFNYNDSAENHYNDIIRILLGDSGVPLSGKYAARLDNLGSRDSDDTKIHSNVTVRSGESRGDKLKDLCRRWNIDAYFDPMGIFKTEDRTRDSDRAPVWKFYSSDDRRGMLVSMRRTFNDDNLYNYVAVVGLYKKKPFKVFKVDNDPSHKLSAPRIGTRSLIIRNDKINTVKEANKALQRAWGLRTQIGEEIEIKAISNPALEGDDVIEIEERKFAKIDDTYRLRRFNIPLVSSLQTLQVANILRGEDVL